ncbi:MAG: LamG-like jellyroll fold domain-containing protein [Candidatus Heimdallarchaeota archaeon]
MTLYKRSGRDIDRGLVGYWKLDDLKLSGATKAIDRANFNDGTITGATNTTGINGLNPDAMYFDGVDDFVDLNKNLLTYPEDFSISMWIYDYQPVGGISWPHYFHAGRGGSAGAGNYGFTISKDTVDTTDTTVQFQIRTTDSDSTTIASSATKEVWTHFVGTKVGTKVKFYKNGVFVNDDNLTQSEFRESSSTAIGAVRATTQNVKAGIANVRLYNRGLTAGEVSKLHRLRL